MILFRLPYSPESACNTGRGVRHLPEYFFSDHNAGFRRPAYPSAPSAGRSRHKDCPMWAYSGHPASDRHSARRPMRARFSRLLLLSADLSSLPTIILRRFLFTNDPAYLLLSVALGDVFLLPPPLLCGILFTLHKKRERASPTKVSPFLITPTAPGVPRS